MISIIYLDRFFSNDPIGKTLPQTEIGQIIQREAAGGLKDYGIMFFRWYKDIHHWAMLEVYLIGFLITFSNVDKLQSSADATLTWGFYAFLGVMLASVLSSLTLNTQLVWKSLEGKRILRYQKRVASNENRTLSSVENST